MKTKIEEGIKLSKDAIELMKSTENRFFENVRGVLTAKHFRVVNQLDSNKLVEAFEENRVERTIDGQKMQITPLEWSNGELFAIREIDRIEKKWQEKDALLYSGNISIYNKNGTCLGLLRTGAPYKAEVHKRPYTEEREKREENFNKYVTKDNVLKCIATSLVDEPELMSQIPETLQKKTRIA